MKGITKLFDLFLKIMEIGFLTLSILLVFFSITNFSVIQDFAAGQRKATMLGEAILACSDITVPAVDGAPVRGLFNATKLNMYSNKNLPCIRFSKYKVVVSDTEKDSWTLGNSSTAEINYRSFSVAINKGNTVYAGTAVVYVE
ncbi:MAG: hypothetical protein QW751_01665 [Candidatus Aenigmatarchaeota archaeon]|nr:hypothetical protein [Candidatus Aenigmarchaeota archaeon]